MPDITTPRPIPAPATRTVAVVLAGGSGQRIGLATPKQLLKIAGKTILEHTLAIFERAERVDEVVVMMNPGFVTDAQNIVDRAGLTKVTQVIPGGTSRNATTQLALDALDHLPAPTTNVLFHDAVRPMLSQRVIDDCVTALETHEAVDVAIPSSDTIIEVDDGLITDVPTRSRLRRGQTPQAFRLSAIRDAYARAWEDPGFEATDDCSVVLRYTPEVPIHVVAGEEQNMKVTQPVDIFIADKLFQLATSATPEYSEEDYDRGLSGRTVVVFGGSYGIGAGVADLAERHGARVFRYSRSATRTNVANPDDVAGALEQAHAATGRFDEAVTTARAAIAAAWSYVREGWRASTIGSTSSSGRPSRFGSFSGRRPLAPRRTASARRSRHASSGADANISPSLLRRFFEKLKRQDDSIIEHRDADWLREGYRFLSRVRNRLYLLKVRNVDVMPTAPQVLETLALSMGYPRGGWQELEDDRRRHARHVRRVTERLFYGVDPTFSPFDDR